MARPSDEWTFNYAVLSKLTGLSEEVIRQHRHRAKFKPGDLESIIIWCAKYGSPDLRRRILEGATGMQLTRTKKS